MIGVILDFISMFKKNLRKKKSTTTTSEQDCNSYITRFANNNSIISTRAIIDMITPTIKLFILVT